MTLTVDDDVVNGGQAARFAERLKELIEASLDFPGVPDFPTLPAEPPEPRPDDTAAAITAIKAIHTAIFAGIGACVGQIERMREGGRAGKVWREPVCERYGAEIAGETRGSRFCVPCQPLHRAEQKRGYAREYEGRRRGIGS